MTLSIALFVVGLIGLIWSADRLIPQLERAGARFGIPMAMMALLVLALGTSLPELVASTLAAAKGNLEIAVANLFGSNIANSLLIAGAVGLLAASFMGERLTISRDVRQQTWLMLAVALFSTIAIAIHLAHAWLGAIVVMALTAAVVLYSYHQNRRNDDKPAPGTGPIGRLLSIIFGLFVLLVVSGAATVRGVEGIAEALNLSDVAAGAVLLAIGTSLPELVASIAALRRKQAEAAIATVVGSNIINLSVLLAITLLVGWGQEVSRDSLWLALMALGAVSFFLLALVVPRLHGTGFRPWAFVALLGFVGSVYVNS